MSADAPRLRVVPCTLTDARAFVQRHHSHLHAPIGGLCAVGVAIDGALVCVGILSRPVARAFGGRAIAEVSRVASIGAPNAASMTIGALSRAALALGYRRVVSSTLLGERGGSYRAAGWWPTAIGDGRGDDWHSRSGRTVAQGGRKVRWEWGPEAMPRDPDVEAAVRDAVGVVVVPERPETLPLFAGRAP